jgi:hypothetical protein
MSAGLAYLGLAEAAELIRAKKLSPVEYTTALLAQIQKHDSKFNAFIAPTPERALAAARQAEAEIARGDWRGPFHGMPYALKDIIDVEGIATTAHSKVMTGNAAAQNAAVTERLEAAGGVLLGKLSTHEFAIGGPSFDLPRPPARNPWNSDHFCGGSSSGSGAGLAAGFFPAALGTDIAALWLPVAIVATALWQVHIVEGYLGGIVAVGQIWLPVALIGATALTCALLLSRRGGGHAAVGAALALLLAMPAAWSVGTATTPAATGIPTAQPPFLTDEAVARRGRYAMIAGALTGDPKLVAFLSDGRGNAQFLMAAVNARLAAPIIIATGEPVMALGGFAERDPILDVDAFAKLVAEDRVRFVLIGEGSPGLRRVFGEGHQKELIYWIRANGRPVDPALWRSAAPQDRPRSAEAAGAELYDLRPTTPGD